MPGRFDEGLTGLLPVKMRRGASGIECAGL